MAAISNSIFSPATAARFDYLVTIYPVQRSALVPMLLYAQDDIGYVSDEVVAEIAKRLDLLELDVRNVLSYYSMLRTKPAGKYNVQVCTNISCMLRGGFELLDHCKHKLGIGHKGVTEDGLFSLEEVECIGACCWAPAVQVNYDFHENLTPAKIDQVLEDYAAGRGTDVK
ncbi:NADH dehydrogenase subunit E [Bryocella elongata]|uniref:NADH dehydrogenase subunit E n=1 Tax=Bryocella elongata TaxID=863522 RepID=A0A1H5T8L6_9BACT|nr:NAD(P)H-dependent oxidoreductase subunit E [Bryocella elongata]SEF59173.1 NADH dehydrogenase subunit E [Bryocella elongata]